MVRRICQWIFLLLLVSAGLKARANEAVAVPSPGDSVDCKIRRWTTDDGLPQNRIACIQQTRDGYLWLGTWFGLARFDGVKFTVFSHEHTPAFASDTICSLAEDADGALWIGTKNGLLKFRDGTFRRFTTADGLPANDIWQAIAARTGGIWFQAGETIMRERENHFTAIWRAPPYDNIRNIEEDANGHANVFCDNTWLDLTEGATVHTNYSPQIGTRFPNGGLYSGGTVWQPGQALLPTSDGVLLVKNNETNCGFIGGKWSSATSILLHEANGKIWVQSRTEGLQWFDGIRWRPADLGEFRSDIVCAMADAQGNLWLGTESGLLQLRFQKVQNFTTREGLPDDNVWTVCQSADGAVWAGTDHGLAVLQSNRVETAATFTNNSAGPIHCVCPARDGGTWVASQNEGLVKIHNGQAVDKINYFGIPSALYEDGTGRLWIATVDGPVRSYQDGRLESPVAGTESLRDIRAFYQDRQGDFWFGTANELVRLHDGKLSTFGRQNGLPAGRIWSIYQDADGTFWLGTEKGLVRFAAGNFFQFNEQPQMPADTINCVLEDEAGSLWLSTLHGIYRVDRRQLNAVAEGKMASVQPFIVGTADGMKTSESNGEVQPAGWKARDGRLWFPTGKGLVVIAPKLFSAKENPPRPLVDSLKADGMVLASGAGGKIKIVAGRGHSLEFNFTACDLAAPEAVRFQTRLSGVDGAWSEPTADRTANYFNLRPGDYRFEVRAMDHHGQWSAPVVLAFSIAPCFWQTWWFYVFCAAGLLLLAAGIQAYRLRWQHRLLKLEQQRALANERARIARDLHDDLGTALTGMALELDVLGRDAQTNLSLIERLAKASQHTRQLAERMREVVWMVNPRCDNLRSLADFLEDQAALLLRAAGLKVHLEFPLEIPNEPVTANVRHQLALSVREAFTNIIRHAHASEAGVRLELTEKLLSVVIRDNGCGFEPRDDSEKEHGLGNLRRRMEEISGSFQCVSARGSGTIITLRVPLKKYKSSDKKS